MSRNGIIAVIVILVAGAIWWKTSHTEKPVTTDAAATAPATTAPATTAPATTAPAETTAPATTAPAETTAPAATAPAETTAPATTAPAMTDASAALSEANFDAAKVTAMIDASALDDATKTSLKAVVTAAASDPTKKADAVAQVKKALGL